MSDVITLWFWNSETHQETEVTADLDHVIRNPSGFRLDTVGLHLLNRERRKLGLTQYAYNSETKTYDEVS